MTRCGCGTTNATTCAAIVECVAANLGRGLQFTGGEFSVRLSTDPDNITTIGTDDGLFTPATGIGPGEQTWLKTVATLPAQCISANSGGNLVGPATQPQLIEYAIANGIDMYVVPVVAAADGAAVELLTTNMDQSVTVYSDNPGPLTWKDTSSLTMSAMNYDAGTRDNPAGANSDAPAAQLTPYGGWGGFYFNQYPARTVAEMLRQIRGRMVVCLNIPRQNMTEDQIEQSVRAAVQAVVDAGAQDWCIIEISGYLDDDSRAPLDEWIPLITAAGITAGANYAQTVALTDPWTGAETVATGATWVTIIRDDGRTGNTSDARVTEMVTAGLNVIALTTGRQYWTTHNFGLGARCVRSPDGVYARGGRGEPGDLDYRLTYIPGLETRTAITGAFTTVTDATTAVWDGGFARLDLPGRWFPPRYGWVDGVTRFGQAQTLGTISPIPDTANFELRMRVRRHSGTLLSSARFAGFFWGAVDDRDISHVANPGVQNPLRDGYGCVVREPTSTGVRQGVYRYDNGVETALSTTTGGPGWLADQWVTLIVTVTGSSINFQAVGPSSSAVLSTSSATYRGPYVFYFWNDAGTGSATQYHGYDNGAGLVMYEAQS